MLAQKLKEALDEKYHEGIDIAIFGNSLVRSADVLTWMESMRDVTRLFNSIMLNLAPLLGEVEIKDFIQLEILRLRYPVVYEMLFRQKALFLQADNEEGVNRKYVLRRGKDMPNYIKVADTEKNEKYGLKSGIAFTSNIASILLFIVIPLIILSEFFMPSIVYFIAPGFLNDI